MVGFGLARVNTPPYGAGMKNKLSSSDWIQAGFRALTAGGPQAIKVEAIARGLKVSKGSFYWHFKDVPGLKSAMLEHWAKVATDDVVHSVEAGATSPAEQLRNLVEFSTNALSDPYGGAGTEVAIRDWARYDVDAGEALKSVDLRRLQFVRKLFKEHGVRGVECTSHANILYGALIGIEALSQHGFSEGQSDLAKLLELLLRDV